MRIVIAGSVVVASSLAVVVPLAVAVAGPGEADAAAAPGAAAEPAAAAGPTADAAPPPGGGPAAPAPAGRPARGTPEDEERRAKVLAVLGDHTLAVGQFEDELSDERIPPPVRAGYANPDRVREEFERRVQQMALAAYARESGLEERSDVRREVRKRFRGVAVNRHVQEAVTEDAVSDADVAAYYEAHVDQYNRPEMANAGQILLADRGAAEEALARALAVQGDRRELNNLVHELSQDPTSKGRGGSLGSFDREGRVNRVRGAGQPEPPRVDPAIVAAAFTLTEAFTVYREVVDTQRGPAVVFLLNRTPAVSRSVEEVGPRIRLQLLDERREQARLQYLEAVRERADVRVEDANFNHVVIAPGDPGPAGGPDDMFGPGPPRPPVPFVPPPVAP